MLVAEHRGELLGLCTAYLDMNSVRFGPRCWVEDLAVSPDHRSQGVGKALLDAAKDWARDRGATHLELDSADARDDAHRFYEREAPELAVGLLRLGAVEATRTDLLRYIVLVHD